MGDASFGVSPESSSDVCPSFSEMLIAGSQEEPKSVTLLGLVLSNRNGVRLLIVEGVEGDFVKSPALARLVGFS